MTISFHCEYCNKKIEAKDTAGGKWANCPACHNKIYIPAPIPDDEELRLAPIDENERKKQEELMAETFQLSQRILNEREVPDEPAKEAIAKMSDEQLAKKIVTYLRLMANGDLDQAQQIAGQIKPYSQKAVAVLDRIAISEMPEPGLEDVPLQVLSGLIRTLRNEIS